jgi:hypothetical protein
LLLPIVNQDITSIKRTNKNQFSKDWQMIFDNKNEDKIKDIVYILNFLYHLDNQLQIIQNLEKKGIQDFK